MVRGKVRGIVGNENRRKHPKLLFNMFEKHWFDWHFL